MTPIPPLRPHPRRICTLVGPTRHYRAFDYAGFYLGRLGWLVFSVGSHRADDDALRTTDGDREVYHYTHRRKIDLSDLVYVVDLPAVNSSASPYYGAHTRAELLYAKSLDKMIAYLSDGRFPEPPLDELAPPSYAGTLAATAKALPHWKADAA